MSDEEEELGDWECLTLEPADHLTFHKGNGFIVGDTWEEKELPGGPVFAVANNKHFFVAVTKTKGAPSLGL